MQAVRIQEIDFSLLEKDFKRFCIFDLRKQNSFEAFHIQDSHLVPNPQYIVDFFLKSKDLRPLLLICFTKQKAKQIALNLTTQQEFLNLYPHQQVFFGSILDAGHSKIPITEKTMITDLQADYPPPRYQSHAYSQNNTSRHSRKIS